MENASKALLMAGSVLVALIIIALLVKSYGSISTFQKMQLSEEEQAQLIAFNEQYTKYLGQYVYGIEVRSLMNKYDHDRMVNVKLLPEGVEPPTDIGQDVQYYKCKEVGYDEKTGKVNSITFEKIMVD